MYASLHLGWRSVEQIEDVAALAVTELDAERVHKNQSRQPMTARRRDLCGEPPAEGKSEQGHLFVGQRLEQVEIKTCTRSYTVSKSAGRGEWPEPGCDGAMISARARQADRRTAPPSPPCAGHAAAGSANLCPCAGPRGRCRVPKAARSPSQPLYAFCWIRIPLRVAASLDCCGKQTIARCLLRAVSQRAISRCCAPRRGSGRVCRRAIRLRRRPARRSERNSEHVDGLLHCYRAGHRRAFAQHRCPRPPRAKPARCRSSAASRSVERGGE